MVRTAREARAPRSGPIDREGAQSGTTPALAGPFAGESGGVRPSPDGTVKSPATLVGVPLRGTFPVPAARIPPWTASAAHRAGGDVIKYYLKPL